MKNSEKIEELGNSNSKYINRDVTQRMQNVIKLFMQKKELLQRLPQDCTFKHLLKRLEIKGVKFAECHTSCRFRYFNPVEVEDLSKHKMDSGEKSKM
jgi:S-adenosylmethionine:tRNA ribosyltransferase-isomerase